MPTPEPDKTVTPPEDAEQPTGNHAYAIDVSNPASPADRLSYDTVKAAILSRAAEAQRTLIDLRAERVKLNARIKSAVVEEQEARRLAAALKPRVSKSKAAK